jgi:dTDP-4-amino-4,6-dideoxygalactose transaminase
MASAHGCRFGIMTNSGTSSLQIALAALKDRYGWHDGDEVIVPAVTFIATSNVVLQNNMKPVFVDVDPVFYEIDPNKIEAAISPKTRCIIPVHLFGCPCDMRPILTIAERHNLRIIEDSCETMFARLNGTSVGSFGDVACFSTYVAHILTTGVGGLCTTNDPDLAVRLRSLMNHGRDSIYLNIDDDDDKSEKEKELIIQRRFRFVQMGFSYRTTEMEAAIGVAEYEIHPEMMKRRLANANYLIENLKPFEDRLQLPTRRKDADHAFMMFPVVLKEAEKRDIVNYLEANSVETRDMLPVTNQPFYKKVLNLNEDDYPVAKWINRSGFYFACHHNLSSIEREYIVEVFRRYFTETTVQQEKTCLILMSKEQSRAAQLMIDAIPLGAFDELIFLEGSGKIEETEFFERKGFTIIAERMGKGALLRNALSKTQCENIVVMGADGTDNPEDIHRLLILLQQGNDLVIASRFMPGGGRETYRPLSYRSLVFVSSERSVFQNRDRLQQSFSSV